MLREQQQVFRSILVAIDTMVIAGACVLAYLLRFKILIEPLPIDGAESVSFRTHSIPILAAVPIVLLSMLWCGLYQPRRDRSMVDEAIAVAKATAIGTLLIIACLSLFRNVLFDSRDYSTWQFAMFAVSTMVLMTTWRFVFRSTLRWIRRRGWNLRHVAIVGTGRLGQIVCHTLRRNSWTGITPSYFIAHTEHVHREDCLGLPVVGGLADLEHELAQRPVSGVFVAMPGKMAARMPEVMATLERFALDVRIVPDMNPKYLPVNMSVSELEGMPILSVRESPMGGWGRYAKRTLDLVGSLVALAIFGLPMLVIAILIRRSGPGPIIFRQERMSLNGRRFEIFKFRTMVHADTEAQALRDRGVGGDAWTRGDDPRITSIGRLLRRTSLDELPQLFNVVLGEMSLVGPRPERAEVMARWREDWRGSMLRQNVKSGMTGWAQVNGLRGPHDNLRKRMQYDLFYVRNWSLMFDLRILWMTVFRGFVHPNAQ